ncbi:MAG TPA: hypothetical protein VIH61_04065, partial [Waddliaceae bacterium]
MFWIRNYFLHQSGLTSVKILKLTFLALVYAQNFAFSEGSSEQIWKFEEGTFPKQNVRNILDEKNHFPVIRDNPNNVDREDEWDIDWQNEEVDLLPLEITASYNSEQFLQSKTKPGSTSKIEETPHKNGLIYSLREAEEHLLPLDKALNIHSNKNFSFNDANDEEWTDMIQARPSTVEISTATQGPSKIIDNAFPQGPTLEDVAYEMKFIGEETEYKDDTLEMPCSLGKKTITTDPYSVFGQEKAK